VCDLNLGKEISNEELLELPVDVLVPAALEQVIHQGNAPKVQAKLVIEMANGPVTTEADVLLTEKGVTSVPDILSNAGGVTVSYFEWAQNLAGYYWKKEEVFFKLKEVMSDAFERVWGVYLAGKENGHAIWNMRTAAYKVAVERVVEAMQLRGT
jgi:glutamate dehydrogenase/leucine dehydrogenase